MTRCGVGGPDGRPLQRRAKCIRCERSDLAGLFCWCARLSARGVAALAVERRTEVLAAKKAAATEAKQAKMLEIQERYQASLAC